MEMLFNKLNPTLSNKVETLPDKVEKLPDFTVTVPKRIKKVICF
jgi:hypothetical protein